MKEVPVFTLWMEITSWILDRTEDFPKKFRYSMSNRIVNITLKILEMIIEALYINKKTLILKKINIEIEKLRIFLRLCRERKMLSENQYECIQEKLYSAGKMIGGWFKHSNRNEQSL